jgi:fructose-1,6-bisphosphatase/inositol monophosphatase family enzyme
MRKRSGSKKELDGYIESVKASQKNTIWPDVLRGDRSVDELLWKGARDAPLVQRIGAVILALAYVMVGLAFVSMSVEQGKWFIGAFAALLFIAGGWFIRNALRR